MKALVAGLLLLLGMYVWMWHRGEQAVDFYVHALAQAHSEEVVTLGARTYRVLDSAVYQDSTEISGTAALPMLKLAYEVTLARRDPPLALPGTDPKELRSATAALIALEGRLAAAQANANDNKLALRLYPTKFLYSLADLEEARQAFITAPSPQKARTYEGLVVRAMHEKDKALKDFADAFAIATKDSLERGRAFGGILSSTTVAAAVGALAGDLPNETRTIAEHVRCSAGATTSCAPLLSPVAIGEESNNQKPAPSRVLNVLGLWDAANDYPPLSRTSIWLPESVCLPDAGAVNAAFSTRQASNGSISALLYTDDIFFYRLSTLKDSPYVAYMRKTYGMQYSNINPFKFYLCPQIGIDHGAALGVVRTVQFAREHPVLARRTRIALMGGANVPSPTDAQRYITQALAETEHTNLVERHQLEELALMVRTKTGGLEDIVKDIVLVLDANTDGPLKGINNIKTSYLFLTHSAFLTLFRIGASDGAPQTSLRALYATNPSTTKKLLSQITTYSSLRSNTPNEVLVHDLRSFLAVENKLASTTPSSAPSAR